MGSSDSRPSRFRALDISTFGSDFCLQATLPTSPKLTRCHRKPHQTITYRYTYRYIRTPIDITAIRPEFTPLETPPP